MIRHSQFLEYVSKGPLGSYNGPTLQQVWKRLPGQYEQEGGESLKGQSGEEDGAVEALVHSELDGGGQPTEAAAERRRGWLQRLGQLQNVAASAASTVGGMGNILPTYIHFGQPIAWPALRLSCHKVSVADCHCCLSGRLSLQARALILQS